MKISLYVSYTAVNNKDSMGYNSSNNVSHSTMLGAYMTQKKKRHHILTMVTTLLISHLLTGAAAGPGPAPMNARSGKWWPEWDDQVDTSLASTDMNVTAVEGHTAYLPCRVLNLQDKKVSWIRARDLTVLAVERTTVTTDARFSVKHPEKTVDWILEIRGTQLRDAGTYDCQVNTYPKKSTRVHLKVLSEKDADVFLEIPAADSIVPRDPAGNSYRHNTQGTQGRYYSAAERYPRQQSKHQYVVTLHMKGGLWAEVTAGKTLGLSCEATGGNLQEAYASSRAPNSRLIEWTLDEVPVTMLFDKQKVELYEEWQSDMVLSQLTLFDLTVADSGSFACHAPHAHTQTIPVTVLHPGSRRSPDEALKMYTIKKLLSSSGRQSTLHQMDAATSHGGGGGGGGPGLQAEPRSIAASCSSHRTIVISGAVMLAIMLLNCALAVAMCWKTH